MRYRREHPPSAGYYIAIKHGGRVSKQPNYYGPFATREEAEVVAMLAWGDQESPTHQQRKNFDITYWTDGEVAYVMRPDAEDGPTTIFSPDEINFLHSWLVPKDRTWRDISHQLSEMKERVQDRGMDAAISISLALEKEQNKESESENITKEEHAMYDKLTALADALQGMGESSTATLVRVLEKFAQASWTERFFQANPDLLERADEFATAKGMSLAAYLAKLDSMSEAMGRRKVHQDLGYVGMPWSATKKPADKPEEPEAPEVTTQTEGGDLVWPFPAPVVLKRPEAFISAAIGWAGSQYARTGRKGEIEASRKYLRHLMKDVAPALARTLQERWSKATADPAAQRNLKLWWRALVQVWQRLQDMVGYINSYEAAPGYYGG